MREEYPTYQLAGSEKILKWIIINKKSQGIRKKIIWNVEVKTRYDRRPHSEFEKKQQHEQFWIHINANLKRRSKEIRVRKKRKTVLQTSLWPRRDRRTNHTRRNKNQKLKIAHKGQTELTNVN